MMKPPRRIQSLGRAYLPWNVFAARPTSDLDSDERERRVLTHLERIQAYLAKWGDAEGV